MMTRARMIEILTTELAKSEQMTTADCRRWIERGMAKVEEAEAREVSGIVRRALSNSRVSLVITSDKP
jgi:hypothetical protein